MSRFLPAVPEIAQVVLALVEEEVPELRDAPWRDRAADEDLLRFELERRLVLAGQGEGYGEADLAELAARFGALARAGAPLRVVQQFSRTAVAHAFAELWARAEPGDVTELLRLSQWLARHNGVVERLLVQSYCALLEPGAVNGDERRMLADRLLAGLGSPADTAADEDDAPASGYLVVVLDAPANGLEGLPATTLATTVDDREHLLIPLQRGSGRERDEMARWAQRRGRGYAAAEVAETADEVPSAAAAARRLLAAAQLVGLPPGLVGRRDLVLEATLAAQPQGLRDLAAVLGPIEDDERLLETLTAFFAHDLDRTRTAAALFLSRGGLALRLDRIAQLTGLDPRSTRGVQVLGAALSARSLRDLPGSPPAAGA
jgi:hypothetical protein